MSTAESASLPWSTVQHTADRVAIVGSGPSLAGVDLRFPANVTVIAVNAAILHLPEPPDFWFTLDLSRANRAIIAEPIDGVVYYAAANPGPEREIPPAHRRPLDATHVLWLQKMYGPGGRSSRAGLSEWPGGVHPGNSGYGALGLAYLMGARRIALLGIDATGGYAWGKGAPKRLEHLPYLFCTAGAQLEKRGVQLVNGSPNSAITCYPRMAPEQAIAWLAS